jgi:hypothetical protein
LKQFWRLLKKYLFNNAGKSIFSSSYEKKTKRHNVKMLSISVGFYTVQGKYKFLVSIWKYEFGLNDFSYRLGKNLAFFQRLPLDPLRRNLAARQRWSEGKARLGSPPRFVTSFPDKRLSLEISFRFPSIFPNLGEWTVE